METVTVPGQDGICLDGARYRREKGGVRLEQAPPPRRALVAGTLGA